MEKNTRWESFKAEGEQVVDKLEHEYAAALRQVNATS